mgnify:FL=1
MNKNAIEIQNLQKSYHGTTAVDIQKLTIRQGEIYGFLGPNGAGKSTTMKMILSLIHPDAGSIRIFGREITNSNAQYLSQIGSMIEEPSYYPNLTGYENLSVFQKMLQFPKENIKEMLHLVGLDEEKNRKKCVGAYSLGMKQRLALAFALVKRPKLLLLDEPTNGLDPAGIHEIRELIVRLTKDSGLTVLISSHILPEIEHIADRVGIIHHGKLLFEGRIDEIQSKANIVLQGDFSKLQPVENELKKILQEQDTHHLTLPDLPDQKIADIIFLLSKAKIPIYRVVRNQESLENIFLHLTQQ